MAANDSTSSSVEKFIHPHPLVDLYEDTKYTCNGCETMGHGQRYRCDTCRFDLHQECAACPLKLSAMVHPQHALDLVVRKHKATRRITRYCDVCGDHVDGLFYRCKGCEFDVHPLCTLVPQNVRHKIHPPHALTLKPGSRTTTTNYDNYLCLVCNNKFVNCRYRCETCVGVHVHVKCVLNQSAPPQISNQRPEPRRNVATHAPIDPFDMASLFDVVVYPAPSPQRSLDSLLLDALLYSSVPQRPLGTAGSSPQILRQTPTRSPGLQATASNNVRSSGSRTAPTRPGAAGSSSAQEDSEKAMTLY